MITLVNILILFFILLICYQIFLAYFNNTFLEGLTTQDTQTDTQIDAESDTQTDTTEYKPYDTNNPDKLYSLSQQNASNIIALNKEVQDMSSNIVNLQSQVNGLVQAQQEYAQKMTPSSPPQISGAVQSDTNGSSSTTSTTGTSTTTV